MYVVKQAYNEEESKFVISVTRMDGEPFYDGCVVALNFPCTEQGAINAFKCVKDLYKMENSK